ncbi:MAG: ABC transporter permease [Candidatus Hermodarchaeota archaeon]
MSLRTYLVKRFFIAIVLFFTVLVFNFFLFRLPIFVLGMDPMTLYIEPGMEPDTIALLREQYGIPEQNAGFAEWFNHFLLYMRNMVTLEFGQSFDSNRPVSLEIMERLPNTIILMGTATVTSILLGVVSGIIAASRHGGKLDTGFITVGLSLYSVPVFWVGMMLLLFFAFFIPIFPMGKSLSYPIPTNPISRLLDLIWHLILPCTTLTLGLFGGYMLLMRNTLVEVLTEDYILTAKAKGLAERTVLFKHGLRNAFLPLITVIAISFAFIVSGAVLTETVFAWYGMGRLLFQALLAFDWPVTQAIFWMIAVTVIIANILADLLYGVLDPRIKYG